MAEPKVAIVVPVLDEVSSIGAVLDDCRAQTLAPAEVIVVDAGSTDGTAALLAERERTWPALTVLSSPGAPPGRGRNVGIRHAEAEIVATLDAGSRVGPGWLAALVAAQSGGTAPRLAVGVAVPDAHSEFERAAGWFTLRGFKPPDRPGPIGREFLPAGRNGYCFARATWQAAGGFPEELPWGEDKTFLRRMHAAGAEVVVAPDAEVRWRPRTSLAAVCRQYGRYGRGDAMAGIDRQNSLVPFVLYAAGAALLLRAGRGDRAAGVVLACAATGYLGLFAVPAARELGRGRAALWIPVLRVAVDLAKMQGFVRGMVRRP
ncbi:MAG: glycosyltransferase [Solirubrobacteraceae bacterium]